MNAVTLTPQQEQLQRAEMLRNKGIICLQYFNGKNCRRSNCPYAHITDGEVRQLPEAPCVFFQQGSCLRERCKFFHGLKKDYDAMKAAGQTTYRPQDFMPVMLAPTDDVPMPLHAPSSTMHSMQSLPMPMQTPYPTQPVHYLQPMQSALPPAFHYPQQLPQPTMVNLGGPSMPQSAPHNLIMHDAPAPQLVHHQMPYFPVAQQVLPYQPQFIQQLGGSYFFAQ